MFSLMTHYFWCWILLAIAQERERLVKKQLYICTFIYSIACFEYLLYLYLLHIWVNVFDFRIDRIYWGGHSKTHWCIGTDFHPIIILEVCWMLQPLEFWALYCRMWTMEKRLQRDGWWVQSSASSICCCCSKMSTWSQWKLILLIWQILGESYVSCCLLHWLSALDFNMLLRSG